MCMSLMFKSQAPFSYFDKDIFNFQKYANIQKKQIGQSIKKTKISLNINIYDKIIEARFSFASFIFDCLISFIL